jgi:putative acetyltransferase
MTSTVIAQERPDTPDARALIDELETYLIPLSPDESRHGYSVEKLIAQGVAFFVIRVDGEAVGCGGIQLFDGEYGELKRMYVRPRCRGRGLAKQMLERLAAHARSHGIAVLRLETGVAQTEAIGLYEGWGFREIPPFGAYKLDPHSVFYEKRLN